MRKVLVVALVTSLALLATAVADAAVVSAKPVSKTFDVALPGAGGQTFAVITIQGKAKGGAEPDITLEVANLDQIPLDIRMAGAVTKAATKKGKTKVLALVAINSLAVEGAKLASFQGQSAGGTADALELVVTAAALAHPTLKFRMEVSTDAQAFCEIENASPASKIARYIELAQFPSPPEAIFQNVKIDGGC